MQPPDLELIRGTLDLFVLKALSGGPMHGLAVLRWIEHRSGNSLQIAPPVCVPYSFIYRVGCDTPRQRRRDRDPRTSGERQTLIIACRSHAI